MVIKVCCLIWQPLQHGRFNNHNHCFDTDHPGLSSIAGIHGSHMALNQDLVEGDQVFPSQIMR